MPPILSRLGLKYPLRPPKYLATDHTFDTPENNLCTPFGI
jgi:hypothetical protein